MDKITLTPKEHDLRNFILTDKPLKVILKIGIPIALFQLLNQFFRILDTFMAAGISAQAASMVAYFGQLNFVFGSVAGGLSIGAALKIGQSYGSGDYKFTKKQINSMVALIGVIIVTLGVAALVGAIPFLRLIGTPYYFIEEGSMYFFTEFFTTLLMFFNLFYIALEKAQGNSKKILVVNLISALIKLLFTAFGLYVLNAGIIFLAISTLLSQLFIASVAIFTLNGKSEVFKISITHMSFKSEILKPIILISLPIIFSQSVFHIGKVIVNAMLISQGSLVIGAAGIATLITGTATTIQVGMKEAAVSVMNQNKGAGKINRSIASVKKLVLINTVVAIVLFFPLWFLARLITGFFAVNDVEFHMTLLSIFQFMIWNLWPFIVTTSVNALLLTFGYTKLIFIQNLCALFVFRIPILWLLQTFTDRGSEAAGIVMIASNVLSAILAVIIVIRLIPTVKEFKNI